MPDIARSIPRRKDGFTLIELVVVIALITILSAVAFVFVSGAINDARVATDAASLRLLNDVTRRYSLSRDVPEEGLFESIPAAPEPMQVLIDAGFLEQPVESVQRNAAFVWNRVQSQWELSRAESRGLSRL